MFSQTFFYSSVSMVLWFFCLVILLGHWVLSASDYWRQSVKKVLWVMFTALLWLLPWEFNSEDILAQWGDHEELLAEWEEESRVDWWWSWDAEAVGEQGHRNKPLISQSRRWLFLSWLIKICLAKQCGYLKEFFFIKIFHHALVIN